MKKSMMRQNGIGMLFLWLLLVSYSMKVNAQKPSTKEFEEVIKEAYDQFKDVKEGKNADYIKELAHVDPNIYGIAIVTVNGDTFTAGDLKSEVSIQSISKAFVLAKVIDLIGAKEVEDKIGVNATGLPFNSIVALENNRGTKINSLVNAGAIATTSLIPGDNETTKWDNIIALMNEFAGRSLNFDKAVYISEAGDNKRNQAAAMLMKAYERIYFDPIQTVDIYTKQCAIAVNANDLAVMAATLANGGVNPLTKKEVVSTVAVEHTLPVMATAGLYEDTGIWLYNVGLPAKSGVGGGIIAVCPGKFGIAVIAPPLDKAGNSVKAQLSIRYIVNKLGVNPFKITPQK